jgi:hypothetical protein
LKVCLALFLSLIKVAGRRNIRLANQQSERNAMTAKRKIPTAAQLQAQCDRWNRNHPEGTTVVYEDIIGDGETHRGKSISEAQVMGGHSAVIWLEGKSGCVSLDHCTALKDVADARV